MINRTILSLGFMLSVGQVFAGTPYNPLDQEACLKKGVSAPGLMRVGFGSTKSEISLGSAVLISAQSIGASSAYEGRLFVSARHVFSDYLKTVADDIKSKKPGEYSAADVNRMANHFAGENFFLSLESAQSAKPQRHFIKKLFCPKNLKKNPNSKEVDDNDIVFGLLSEPVRGLNLPKISSKTYEEVMSLPLVSAGFGVTQLSCATISDDLPRGGDQTATTYRGNNCFVGVSALGKGKTPLYSETGDSGGAGFAMGENGELDLVGVIIGGLNAAPVEADSLIKIDRDFKIAHRGLTHYCYELEKKFGRVTIKDLGKSLIQKFKEDPLSAFQSALDGAKKWISHKFQTLFHRERNKGTIYLYVKDKIKDFVEYLESNEQSIQSNPQFEVLEYPKSSPKEVIIID